MTEKTLERNLRDRVKDMGGLAIKVWPVSMTGLPDRLILMPGGKVHFAELKSPGERPKPHQLAAHRLLRDLGFTLAVIDSAETLKTFLEGIKC